MPKHAKSARKSASFGSGLLLPAIFILYAGFKILEPKTGEGLANYNLLWHLTERSGEVLGPLAVLFVIIKGTYALVKNAVHDHLSAKTLTAGKGTTSGQNIRSGLLSDRQLVLRYSTTSQWLGMVIVGLLFPIWGTGAVWLAIGKFFTFDFLGLTLCVAVLLAGICALVACMDSNLSISELGFAFPLYMLPGLRFRRERLWKDIARFKVASGKRTTLAQGKLLIIMTNGECVPLSLNVLGKQQIEQLLLCIDVWGRHCEKDPEIRSLQALVQNEQSTAGIVTYTQMWEEEMNRRFSSTAFVPLTAGQTLQNGRLQVTKQLAFGGLSAIYLAQVSKTDTVVLKEFVVPDVEASLKAKAQELFEREAQLLMKLSHPQIVKVRDCFVEQKRSYMVLDHIAGSDLRQLVAQRGPRLQSEVLDWAQQLASILVYLHGQSPKVVHRDVTPDNIVLSADGRLVLIDFGAANEFVGTATGTLIGKQSYIAPEQFRGDTVPESDIYSLGATMFYLLTGHEPTPLSQSSPRALIPSLSAEVDQLVADCTAFEVATRIRTGEELLRRIAEIQLTAKDDAGSAVSITGAVRSIG